MATLTVGSGQQYSRIADAIAASSDGDVVAVQAGTYVDDFATIYHKITLQGIGGMVHMVGTTGIPNGKAILVTDNDVTIDHFEFSGARVRDENGAGIRYEAGNLTITNSYFHHNENGLLGAPDANGTITVKNSEFAYNGTGDGRSHNIYVGAIKQFTVQDSYFHDAVIGHEIKSRALNNTITGSRIFNNNGNASYEIDLPQGGNGLIQGNIIQQGPNSENPAIIAFGEEGALPAQNSLIVRDNTIVNDHPNATAVWNATGASATMENNRVYGFGGIAPTRGDVSQSGTSVLSSRPSLNTDTPIGAGTTIIPAPPPPTPVLPVVIGSGPDSLVLQMAEDSFMGDAQFVVRVDGQQIGGVQTVLASHAAGMTQSFSVMGTFGAGAHTAAVTFINDAFAAPGMDRNLYVAGASYNGVAVSGAASDLLSNSTAILAIAGSTPVVTPPAATDSLVLHISEDNWQGDAQFVVTVDGMPLGGLRTATASHAGRQTQDLTVGNLSAGPHSVGITFLNDKWGGTAATDRNLYLDGVDLNGVAVAGSARGLFSNGETSVYVGSGASTAVAFKPVRR